MSQEREDRCERCGREPNDPRALLWPPCQDGSHADLRAERIDPDYDEAADEAHYEAELRRNR